MNHLNGRPQPVVGELRLRRRFAWFPTQVDTGSRVWLRSYYELQMYTAPYPMTTARVWLPRATFRSKALAEQCLRSFTVGEVL